MVIANDPEMVPPLSIVIYILNLHKVTRRILYTIVIYKSEKYTNVRA